MSDSKTYWAEQEQERNEKALKQAQMLVKDKLEFLERENASLKNALRFQAACSAMQGLLAATINRPVDKTIIKNAVKLADMLLEELNTVSK